MTGEQKPGGLEVVAWLVEPKASGPRRARLHRPHTGHDHRLSVTSLTPAEPAEARIRELEREVEVLNKRLKLRAKVRDTWEARATAAEAKLARAVELVKKAKDLDVSLLHDGYDSGPGGGNYVYADVVRTDELFPLLDQTLAALQQEGE